jgi:hypothetical protein
MLVSLSKLTFGLSWSVRLLVRLRSSRRLRTPLASARRLLGIASSCRSTGTKGGSGLAALGFLNWWPKMGRWAKSARGGQPDSTSLPGDFQTAYAVDADTINFYWVDLTPPWTAEYELLDTVAPAPILESVIVADESGTMEFATAYSGIGYAIIQCRPVLGTRRGEWFEVFSS